MSTRRTVIGLALCGLTLVTRGALAQTVTVTPPPETTTTGTTSTEAPPEPVSQKPVASGYDPDSGFALRSPDDQWKLRIGLQAAWKVEPIWVNGKNQNRGSFAFLRPYIGGNVFRKWIRFWNSMDLASNPPYVLDSYIEAQPVDAVGVRGGQFWTPISRHEQFGPGQLLFPEFNLVADYFWPGRDKGVMAFGQPFNQKLEYYAGVFGGSPLRAFRSIPGNWQAMTRVAWNPLGPPGGNEFPYIVPRGAAPAPFRFSIAAQGWAGRVQQAAENFNQATFRFDFVATDEVRRVLAGGVDMFLQGSHFAFLAEGYVRRSEYSGAPRFTSMGAFAQLGVLIIPHFMDVGARVNLLNPSTTLSGDRFWSIEAQTAFYIHAPTLILKLRYGYGRQDSPGEAALGKVPLPVANVGNLHIATAQLNLMF